MVEVVALCVTVVLAVVGFIVNARAARRAKRRDIRTQFLLTAYRGIESASNRPLDASAARDLELALADVHLLGTDAQVKEAHQFADEWATNGGADAGPLLDELRRELRADLDLGPLSQRRTHLRISLGRDHSDIEWSDNARISAEAVAAQQRASALAAGEPSPVSSEAPEILLPGASAAWEALLTALTEHLEKNGVLAKGTALDEQLRVAVERELISDKTSRGIGGLSVMWGLLLHDARAGSVPNGRAEEFTLLASAIRGLFDAGIAGPVRP
jgi:hypothetical protein